MLSGMTGFGSIEKSVGKIKFVIEIKSQNHRYLDIVFYLPTGFASAESKIRDLISKEIQRGRVIVSVKIVEKAAQSLTFNKDVVKDYLHHAGVIKKEFGLVNDIGLSDILRLPGVFETRESFVSAEEAWPTIESGIRKTLQSLLVMRRREGKSLVADFRAVLKRMVQQTKKIEARTKVLVNEKKKKAAPDEFSSFQKSNDINEEVTRLGHYIEEFTLLLKSSLVGKKMDFVAQEMQRETNTIGSKVQDQVVSNAVIALKSKIEKLREQAQNVE